MTNMPESRRTFLKQLGAVGLLAPFAAYTNPIDLDEEPLNVHVFSKHLQFLDYQRAAEAAARIGFNGVDLTVRPKGHVLPGNVKTDLPRAVAEIRKAGLNCEMITTAIGDADDPVDRDVIETAANVGVKYYRSNWFKFKNDLSFETSLEYYKDKIRELGELNKKHNLVGCYQNHSGTGIGASVWEIKMLLESVDHEFFGTQYDIRHAVAEGGRSWPNGVRLLKEHIKTIVIKDFKWGKVNGKWQIVNVPVGEGMVDFDTYFKLLKGFGLKPPVCLHLEYPLGGAEKGGFEITVDPKVVYDAMKKDLKTLQKLWQLA